MDGWRRGLPHAMPHAPPGPPASHHAAQSKTPPNRSKMMAVRVSAVLAWALALTNIVEAFNPITSYAVCSRSSTSTALFSERPHDDYEGSSRRSFLERGATIAAASAASSLALGPAVSAASAASGTDRPVCVIGCNGRTGTEVVSYCLSKGIPTVATSRGGAYNARDDVVTGNNAKLLKEMVCDVTVPSTVEAAVENSRGVVFAASASKQGGPPSAVDNRGLVSVAKACIDAKVPHLVIVSSGAVTKPSSPVYQFLNLFGKIMEEKIKGEDEIRRLYAEHNIKSEEKLTYTVIRPGGLTLDPPRGAGAVELNQGDTKSGRISRADVAALCVESINYPQLTGGTTFECYDADTGAPLATVGLSNIAKKKADGEAFVSGKEQRGATYNELFTGLEKDVGYAS